MPLYSTSYKQHLAKPATCSFQQATRSPQLSIKSYGRTDFERFDQETRGKQLFVGSGSIGKVKVNCKYHWKKARWGVIGDDSRAAGIVYMDVNFNQPHGYCLETASNFCDSLQTYELLPTGTQEQTQTPGPRANTITTRMTPNIGAPGLELQGICWTAQERRRPADDALEAKEELTESAPERRYAAGEVEEGGRGDACIRTGAVFEPGQLETIEEEEASFAEALIEEAIEEGDPILEPLARQIHSGRDARPSIVDSAPQRLLRGTRQSEATAEPLLRRSGVRERSLKPVTGSKQPAVTREEPRGPKTSDNEGISARLVSPGSTPVALHDDKLRKVVRVPAILFLIRFLVVYHPSSCLWMQSLSID
ncbi:hypothetical protein ED733_005181 [Metarhizium rileyi]|uniref:Uncharacterized protein n=1 Tax=Metarhizium rileyi (strain RCEF 4871) TaxID=1649241 RepID=A0A5C6GIQ2_METRR|nr:hypothetical protein ED733_005181 [Metarhizium rileyi]